MFRRILILPLLGCVAVMAIYLYECWSGLGVVTSRDRTYSSIAVTAYRIDLYAKQHNVLPPSLEELPKRDGYSDRITDAWNNTLRYRIFDEGKITITSFGKDGKSGGTGDDADISIIYCPARDNDGVLQGVIDCPGK